MIVADQERYMLPAERPKGYRLPGQEKLVKAIRIVRKVITRFYTWLNYLG